MKNGNYIDIWPKKRGDLSRVAVKQKFIYTNSCTVPLRVHKKFLLFFKSYFVPLRVHFRKQNLNLES